MACASPRRSCHFNEYFNRLSQKALRSKRNTPRAIVIPRKKSCDIGVGAASPSRYAHRDFQAIHAGATEACEMGLRPLATRARDLSRAARSLDQRWAHVYSPIIRTGHSPPSQLSTLVLVIPGKGFLCLQCEEEWKSCGILTRNLWVVVVYCFEEQRPVVANTKFVLTSNSCLQGRTFL